MYINDIFQLNILLLSVGFGFLLAVIYDLLSFVFNRLYDRNKNTFVKDLLYCFISTFLIFIYLLAINFGRIRVFIIIGITIGYACWIVLLRKAAAKALRKIATFLNAMYKSTAYTVSLPIRPVIAVGSKFRIKINAFFAKKVKNLKNIFKTHLKKK